MNKANYQRILEKLTTALLLALIANVFVDVMLRYMFNNSSIAGQELEWHLFSTLFLLGISLTLQTDNHVRVDVIYNQLKSKYKNMIDLLGFVIFILPISILIIYYGVDFAYQSFLLGEQSGDPGGLSYRFIIKSMIPISFVLVILSGAIKACDNYQMLKS